jgi:hypothetical protein
MELRRSMIRDCLSSTPETLLGRTQEREIYARLDTAAPSCDCEVNNGLNKHSSD